MDFTGIDKMSILDYEDKISCVLFAPHCNFRCPFCHNGLTVLDSEERIPFSSILAYLQKRKGMLDAVVVTGGEPTLLDDLKDKIIQIKNMGFLVKLDSNGTNPDIIKDLVKDNLIDYIAMDIKNSPEKYPLTTGVKFVDMDKIKKSIEFIKSCGIPYEFRTTLVSEYHSLEDMDKIGELVNGASQLYLQKFVDREGCIKKGLHEVPEDLANKFKDILVKYIGKVELRGY